jgi:hypothetical protein
MMETQMKHATSDGREIPPSKMETKHLWAARASLLKWLQDEHDPDQRRDLRANLKIIMAEIGRRTGYRRQRS